MRRRALSFMKRYVNKYNKLKRLWILQKTELQRFFLHSENYDKSGISLRKGYR